MEGALGKKLIVSSCDLLWLREIVQEGVDKFNHPIQNQLLLATEPRTRDNIFLIFVLGFTSKSLLLRIPYQNVVGISHLSSARYMPHPCNPSWCNYPNDTKDTV
jgi:hypothetical protein